MQKGRISWCAIVIAVIFAFPGWMDSYSGKQQEKTGAENVTPQDKEYHKVNASQYVGTETCKGCHEDLGINFDRGPHRKSTLAQRQGPQWQGCEACHGPGKEHAESGDPDKIIRIPSLSREESSKRCLGCHQLREEHANFLRSQHMKNSVGCPDCHSIHHAAVEQKLLKVAQPNLCLRCHSEIKLDSSKPFHHEAGEKPVNCAGCHNPHRM